MTTKFVLVTDSQYHDLSLLEDAISIGIQSASKFGTQRAVMYIKATSNKLTEFKSEIDDLFSTHESIDLLSIARNLKMQRSRSQRAKLKLSEVRLIKTLTNKTAQEEQLYSKLLTINTEMQKHIK